MKPKHARVGRVRDIGLLYFGEQYTVSRIAKIMKLNGTYGRDTSAITVYVCDDSINFINQAAYLPDGTLDEELYAELIGGESAV